MNINPMIKADVILDTINPKGRISDRALTLILSLPTMVDAEVEKHSRLATNSSSSRAIGFPITKLQESPYYPTEVYHPATTMHGKERLSDAEYQEFHKALKSIYDHTLETLTPFKDKVHKQHLNRYLTPFAMQTKVVTANYDAYMAALDLRLPEQADPNIRQLAEVMQAAIEKSTPAVADLHIPFISGEEFSEYSILDLCKASAGRLARSSYGNHDKLEDMETSVARADRLIKFSHVSCMEHQLLDLEAFPKGITHKDDEGNVYSGRIRGWSQYRKILWEGLS